MGRPVCGQSCRCSSVLARASRVRFSWVTCSSRWPRTKRSSISPTVISPSRGWRPRRSHSSSSSSGSLATYRPMDDPDVRQQLMRRQRSIALDGLGAERVPGHAAHGYDLTRAGDDTLHLCQPVAQHLGHVRQHLRRPPLGLRAIAAHRPDRVRSTGVDGPLHGRDGVVGIDQAFDRVVCAGVVRHCAILAGFPTPATAPGRQGRGDAGRATRPGPAWRRSGPCASRRSGR